MSTATSTPSVPVVMGAEDSHGTLRRVLAEHAPCRVLDAAAGQGVLAAFLAGRGWDVACADLYPENFRVPGIEVRKANLNRPLPYGDAEFDAVVLANAIHRLFNAAGAIREFHRVLRPGGKLWINANNFATIDVRLRYLFFGSIENRDYEKPMADPEGHVRIYYSYSQIADWLEQAGFRIASLRPAALRRRHRLFAPVGWLIRLAALLAPASGRARARAADANSRSILTGGYYVLIEAVKG